MSKRVANKKGGPAGSMLERQRQRGQDLSHRTYTTRYTARGHRLLCRGDRRWGADGQREVYTSRGWQPLSRLRKGHA